ncbi:eEF1A lysine methyltransferase 2, partial [Tanacetum coccineum]
VLDVGTGNGLLLQELAKQGFSDLTGTDYSEGAIDLAQILADRVMDFLVDDILETKLDKKFHLVIDKGTLDAIGLHPDGQSKLCVSECCVYHRLATPQEVSNYRFLDTLIYYRIMYWESISRLVAPGGLVVITSCNHTRDELVLEVENFNRLKASTAQETEASGDTGVYTTTPMFSYLDHIRTYPTFMFGGSVGSRVATVAFVRS